MDLTGSAFVIGASGIGKACALAFARYGARGIIVADLTLEAASAVAAECKSLAAHPSFLAEAVAVDVTREESVHEAIAYAHQILGRIDYAVNSAGVGVQLANEIAEASVSEFEKMFKVNVTGTFLVTRVLSAIMKTQDPVPVDEAVPARGVSRGSIVNLGSASGFVATPGMVQYTAAKHAVNGVTKNAALDNAKHGIRVNSVCPSWVDTPMIRKAMDDIPELGEMIQKAVPLGRIALAEEVADAVMFLSSPRASYATGCNMILDGGTTLAAHV
ncbi:NAD(P)-binding protein [Neurospora tetraspora]|uniref:NAD(P)-binding protein n=1 Tax=Neurospora tetraspora TaxID=94610 RepID=A0AAE0MWY3_9PEZI|nr:NAD(P)-binding protein [Neurospora tetraspora]